MIKFIKSHNDLHIIHLLFGTIKSMRGTNPGFNSTSTLCSSGIIIQFIYIIKYFIFIRKLFNFELSSFYQFVCVSFITIDNIPPYFYFVYLLRRRSKVYCYKLNIYLYKINIFYLKIFKIITNISGKN